MIVIGDIRSSHLQKWAGSLSTDNQDLVVLSDFTLDTPLTTSSRAWLVCTFFRHLLLVAKTIFLVVFTSRFFSVHYISRYGLTSLFIPSKRLISFPYGSDITVAAARNATLNSIIRYNLGRSRAVIVSSNFLKRACLELVSTQNIHVIPFGIEGKYIAKAQKFIEKTDAYKIGCFKYCRINTYGLDELIEIVCTFQKKYDRNVLLYLIDDGPDIEALKELVLAKNISRNVIFLKKANTIEKMFEYINKVDLTIYPSRRESFGVSLLESMAAGVPSFVAPVGGMRDIIVDGSDGFYCETSHERTVDKIYRFLSNPKKYSQVSAAAVETLQKQYLWESNYGEFRNLVFEDSQARTDA